MASIDIFPLSVGGVQPPLNLLSDIFSKQQGPTNFSYPLDLATNPTFAHAIQFTIFDYDYPGLKEATDGFKDVLNQMMGDAENTNVKDLFNKDVFQQTFEKAKGLSGNALKFIQPQTWKGQITQQRPYATISLYMPDTVNTTFDSNYQSVSMTDTLGLAGYIANALSDSNIRNSDFKNLPTNLLRSPAGKQLAAQLGGYVGEKVGMQGADLTGVLQRVFNQIPNPQMQMIYKGINLREFQFEFIFTPISAKEAASVENIIKKFIYYSVPALSSGTTGGQFLIPPQVFKIKFLYTGGTGIMNAVSDVFKNTMTNILGNQLTGTLIGSNPTVMGGSVNSKLFSIGDCVLTNVNVDYAPNGWAAYSDGHPIQTRLTLQFKEMDIVTKKDIDKNQWAIDSNNANILNQMQSDVNDLDKSISDLRENGYILSSTSNGKTGN